MNTHANAMPGSPFSSQGIPSGPLSATQPLSWSVRRELWENRSIYIAPLVVGGVFLFGFLLSTIRLPQRMRELMALDPIQQANKIAEPYTFAAVLLMITAMLVGIFYCLDALHGERRDRSILFWKSLPVSDMTTVLSKASIPIVVLPLLVFMVGVALQFVMLIVSSVILLPSGVAVSTLWARLPLFQIELVLLYGLTVHALWQAPIYAWLLLVSAWAKRATFLWAVAPLAVVGILDRVIFRASHFGGMLDYLFFGGCSHAFHVGMNQGITFVPLTLLTPLHFLSTPGLWLGLGIAAGLLYAAARLRRNREPI